MTDELDRSRKPPARRKAVSRPTSPHDGEPLSDEIRRRIEEAVTKAVHETGVSVSPEKEQQIAQAVAVTAVQVAYQGPLPPPAVLRDFDKTVPGLGREIADSAWLEQQHRHAWETRALWNDIFIQSGGLFLGWLLAGFCVVFYFYLVLNKYSAWAAAPLLGPPLLATIRTLLPGSGVSPGGETDNTESSPERDSHSS